jgi:hypothetical protein
MRNFEIHAAMLPKEGDFQAAEKSEQTTFIYSSASSREGMGRRAKKKT